MRRKSYATSLILNDKKDIIGAHIIDIEFPDKAKSASDIKYRFRDAYTVPDILTAENLAVKDNKIVTVHGSKDKYNTITINAFGHVIPDKQDALVVLYKAGEKYIVVNVNDRLTSITVKQMEYVEAFRGKFSNIALDKIRHIVRPIASPGYMHNLIELDIQTADANMIENRVQDKLIKWINAPKHRVVLLDIDGTITDESGAVPDEMVETLKKLNALDNTYVILSTGRILEHELSARINSDIVSLGNGTLLFHKGKLVLTKTLDPNICMQVAKFAASKKYACQCYDPEKRLIIQRENSYQHDDPEAKNINNKVVIVPEHKYEHFAKTPKMLIAVDPSIVQQVKQEVENAVDINNCNVIITTKTTVEVVPKGVDKKLTLVQICRFLGITPNEIIAVGDNNNDIPMLKAAGLSFAVSNGTDMVKQSVSKVLNKPMWHGTNELMHAIILTYIKRHSKK